MFAQPHRKQRGAVVLVDGDRSQRDGFQLPVAKGRQKFLSVIDRSQQIRGRELYDNVRITAAGGRTIVSPDNVTLGLLGSCRRDVVIKITKANIVEAIQERPDSSVELDQIDGRESAILPAIPKFHHRRSGLLPVSGLGGRCSKNPSGDGKCSRFGRNHRDLRCDFAVGSIGKNLRCHPKGLRHPAASGTVLDGDVLESRMHHRSRRGGRYSVGRRGRKHHRSTSCWLSASSYSSFASSNDPQAIRETIHKGGNRCRCRCRY
mmetsp:Transcript_24741/g.58091  ORF Transcript_24741/g.58091 Transcript_24741/m.58091 type:complete len:262 (+) Transcript_24741:430-1215(+)